jgi:predicted acylesterase/phospholipase RssA
MKHLGISGGSTKIAGLTGAALEIIKTYKYNPDVVSGISAGSILALPIVLNKWDMLEKSVKNLKLNDFFDISPVNSKGKFTLRAIWRLIIGKSSLGRQKNLVKRLKEFVSDVEFIQYQHSDNLATVYIGTVDFKTGSRYYFNLKDKSITYEMYLQIVLASASVPIFVEEVNMKIENEQVYLFDGGVRDHIGTAWILQNVQNISETISIYARPENYNIGEWKPSNIFSVLNRYIDIVNVETSKSDEQLEDLLCFTKNIKQTKVFLPSVLLSLYDTNPIRLAMLFNRGREAAANAMLNIKY